MSGGWEYDPFLDVIRHSDGREIESPGLMANELTLAESRIAELETMLIEDGNADD